MNSKRIFDSSVKALLHFDFPYFGESGDGLRDEIGILHWNIDAASSVQPRWTGTEIPNFYAFNKPPFDSVIKNVPKFGYRCPNFSGDTDSVIFAEDNAGIFAMDAAKQYEISFFIRPKSAEYNTNKNIFAVKDSSGNNIFLIQFQENLKLSFFFGNQDSKKSGSAGLAPDAWNFIAAQIKNNTAKLFVNGNQYLSTEISGSLLAAKKIEIGGFNGQLDEFMFRHSEGTPNVIPSQPHQGRLNYLDLGGWGSGRNKTASLAGTAQTLDTSTVKINSCAMLKPGTSGTALQISGWNTGIFGIPEEGDEIMIHITLSRGNSFNDTGAYAFRKVLSANDNYIVIDKPVEDEFNLAAASSLYYIQAVSVPDFSAQGLTIQNKKITAPDFNLNYGGGIIVLRCAGTLALNNGHLISSGFGPVRNDNLQITHAGLIDNFVINRGGGVFIIAKGFSADSSSRIGASWSGSAGAGRGVINNKGSDGGAGYGGGGGSDTDTRAAGGTGGVGGGGGYADSSPSIAGGQSSVIISAGEYGQTGGVPLTDGSKPQTSHYGGTQGAPYGVNGTQGGGGGAGGNGTNNSGITGGISGASVIIIAEKFSADQNAVSTGGQGGQSGNGGSQSGAGGSGFCYIAAKEMI